MFHIRALPLHRIFLHQQISTHLLTRPNHVFMSHFIPPAVAMQSRLLTSTHAKGTSIDTSYYEKQIKGLPSRSNAQNRSTRQGSPSSGRNKLTQNRQGVDKKPKGVQHGKSKFGPSKQQQAKYSSPKRQNSQVESPSRFEQKKQRGQYQQKQGGPNQQKQSGTHQQKQSGTFQQKQGGTFQKKRGGVFQQKQGGTVQQKQEGTNQDKKGGTYQSKKGGTYQSKKGVPPQQKRGGQNQEKRGAPIKASKPFFKKSQYSKRQNENTAPQTTASKSDKKKLTPEGQHLQGASSKTPGRFDSGKRMENKTKFEPSEKRSTPQKGKIQTAVPFKKDQKYSRQDPQRSKPSPIQKSKTTNEFNKKGRKESVAAKPGKDQVNKTSGKDHVNKASKNQLTNKTSGKDHLAKLSNTDHVTKASKKHQINEPPKKKDWRRKRREKSPSQETSARPKTTYPLLLESDTHEVFITCHPGLEPTLSAELSALGLNHSTEKLGAKLSISLQEILACNLHLGTASNVLVNCGKPFSARALGELQRKVSNMPWGDLVLDQADIQIKAVAKKCRLNHTGAIHDRILAGISDAMGLGEEDIAENKKRHSLQLLVQASRDVFQLALVANGATPLHNRGYRLETAKAPLREDLAFSLLCAAGCAPFMIDKDSLPFDRFLDPFCGSGTIAIEAASILAGLPPGRSRPVPLGGTTMYKPKEWKQLVKKYKSKETTPILIAASDRDEGAIQAAKANAQRAGVSELIEFSVCSFSSHPWLNLEDETRVMVVSNPPFGRRLSSSGKKELLPIFQTLAEKSNKSPIDLCLLMEDPSLIIRSGFRSTPVSKIKTMHGGIPVSAFKITKGENQKASI